MAVIPSPSPAATVWAGPRVTHGKTDQPDKLAATVWLTRGTNQGLYNSAQEAAFTHFLSPTNTEWADGTTASYRTLSYTDWDTWAKTLHGGPPNTIGVNAVLHLKTEDIYLDIKFLTWATGGPYSYERSTPTATNTPPSVTLTNPPDGARFTAPATFSVQASADDSDGTVANVLFLQGNTLLGAVAAAPFSVTVSNLGPGSYAFTAVASDNGGLSTTSAPVNIIVALHLGYQVLGGRLELSWPGVGGSLQSQTRPPGAGLGTNWVMVPGSALTNRVVVPFDATNGSGFYRLTIP